MRHLRSRPRTSSLSVLIENQGDSAADSVTATFVGGLSASVVGSAAVDIGTLASSESRQIEWTAEVVEQVVVPQPRSFQIELSSSNALVIPATGSYLIAPTVAIEPTGTEVPEAYMLEQSYPNPFNPATTVTFSMPLPGPVRISVFDILGREVATLVDEAVSAGRFEVRFEADDLPSGVYLYRMEAGDYVAVRSMTLVR